MEHAAAWRLFFGNTQATKKETVSFGFQKDLKKIIYSGIKMLIRSREKDSRIVHARVEPRSMLPAYR